MYVLYIVHKSSYTVNIINDGMYVCLLYSISLTSTINLFVNFKGPKLKGFSTEKCIGKIQPLYLLCSFSNQSFFVPSSWAFDELHYDITFFIVSFYKYLA